MEITYDLSAETLAGIFISHGWPLKNHEYPPPPFIKGLLDAICKKIIRGGIGSYMELGRFMVMKDPEFPDSAEIWLRVGHATDYPEDMDTPTTDGGRT